MEFKRKLPDPEATLLAARLVAAAEVEAAAKKGVEAQKKAAKNVKDAQAHATLTSLGYTHETKPTLLGGRCLERHEKYEVSSCSHRWQAGLRGRIQYMKLYHGATVDVSIYETVPFSTGLAPWPNNAHHLVPIAEVRNAIVKLTAKRITLAQHIMCELMDAGYNINFWKNMIVLPSAGLQCAELGLPMHLGFHNSYNYRVRTRLNNIFQPYDKLMQDSVDKNKEHPPPTEPPEDVVGQIRALQDKIYASFTNKDAIAKRKSDFDTPAFWKNLEDYNSSNDDKEEKKALLKKVKQTIHVDKLAASIVI